MRKLIKGIVDFRQHAHAEYKEKFSKLALGQSPDTLFIACGDSRVVPNTFASSEPGDLFVLRNIGNLVPPFHHCDEHGYTVDESVAAALEFSLRSLNISDIVICGHSECAAMRAFIDQPVTYDAPFLHAWLQHAKPSYDRYLQCKEHPEHLSAHNHLSQINVIQQIEHLKTYPWLRERIDAGQLRLHGWWFDLAEADVHYYNPAVGQFVLIDDAEAEIMFATL